MTINQLRQLGSNGPRVFPLGLGCMGMSDLYGPADEGESIATIHAALDAGVTLLDTSQLAARCWARVSLRSQPRKANRVNYLRGA